MEAPTTTAAMPTRNAISIPARRMIESEAKVATVYRHRDSPRATATLSVPQLHSEPDAVAM